MCDVSESFAGRLRVLDLAPLSRSPTPSGGCIGCVGSDTSRRATRHAGHTRRVNLAEWRNWWRRSGEQQLRHLLRKQWDPFEDPEFEASAGHKLRDLGRRLHEGATVVDVRVFLSELRNTRWPERRGRKWTTRDRRAAEK